MWTLAYNGTTKTLAEWRISKLSRRRQSLSISTVAFDLSADIDDEDVFAPESSIIIYRDEVQWFVGRVDQTPRTATGRYQSHGYVLVDPWWYLENLVYQIGWKEPANPLDPDAGLVEKLFSHIILNLNSAGALVTTKAQITSALQFCIDSGAPFQIWSIDLPDVFPPTSEVMDTMCSEIVQRQLRWTPDAVGWFDYTQTPPALHIKQRSALARVTIPVSECIGLDIRPRHDLQVPAVVIKYRRTNMVNGVGWAEQVIDAMPANATGREFRGLVATIDLEGSQVNYSTAEIVCETIKPTDVEWWKGQYQPLADENVANVALGAPVRETALPRQLVSGAVPGWLLRKVGASVVQEKITVPATYDVKDGEEVKDKHVERPLHTEITATDLESGSFIDSLSVSFGQPTPVGLANYLYQATSRLHYDGSFTLSEEECIGQVGLGNVVCIAGALAAYTEMDAVVQTISETIDDGKTSVTFGPPKHLGADDIIEFLQNTRNRIQITPLTAYTQGVSPRTTGSQSAKETPLKNSNADHGKLDKFTVGVGREIVIDRAAYAAIQAANPGVPIGQLQLRELAYCDNGTEKKIVVLASAPF